MARGAPDYSNVRAYGPLHRLDDQAELAARLGSPVCYDRAGSLVWMTDFSYGLQGSVPGSAGATSTYSVSAARSHYGPFSLKLDPSNDVDSYVEWGNVVQFMLEGQLGLEAIVSTDSSPYGIRTKMLYFDGTTQQRAELHYDPQTGDWTIRTGETTWVTVLEDRKLQDGATCWHSIKLVVDVEESKYVRVQVGRTIEDLSDYSLYSLASTNSGQLVGRVMAYGGTDYHAPIYVDAVIITQNEP